jgi:serine/threonine protein kinase
LTLEAIEDCINASFADRMMIVDAGDGEEAGAESSRGMRSVRGSTLARVAGAIPREKLVRIGILGAGSFGLVTFEEDPDTKSTFALKALSKGNIVSHNMISQVQNELSCWRALDSPFWIKLYATYKDQEFVYFLTEPALGGELFDVFQDNPSFFGRLDTTQFYAAGAVLGLQALHEKLIIYRDLKSENIFLDKRGFPKLGDLGLAKFVGHGQTFTACGTPDFLVPEILRLSGHNRAADWWALGIVIFMMMSGFSPFDAEHIPTIYANIVKGFKKELFPSTFKKDLVGVISGLCRKKPQERMTMRDTGVSPLQKHPWFNGFDWDAMENRTMVAPFIPNVRSVEEIKANAPKELPPVLPYDEEHCTWDGDF